MSEDNILLKNQKHRRLKSIAKTTANFFLLLLFLLISQVKTTGQSNDSIISKPIEELVLLQKEVQKKVSIILHISKNASENNFSQIGINTNYVKVISNECGLFESQFDTDFAIMNSRLNDEFEVLDEEDDWYQVRLRDGRKAWISRTCVQQVVKNQGKKVGRLKSINDRSDQLQLAAYLIEEVKLLVAVIDKKAKRKLAQRKTTEEEAQLVAAILGKVRQYQALAESAYLLYIIPEEDNVDFADFLSKVSFLAELQLGVSDFTMVVNENNKVSQKGAIGEFLFDLAYQLDDQSAINLVLSNTNDIIQTPYSITGVDVNYKSKVKSLNWRTGVSLDSYKDAINPFNNYNRLGFQVGGNQKLSKKTSYQINYLLNANRYNEFEGINFTNHAITFGSRTIINSAKSLSVQFRGNAQVGEESRRNFYLLNPSLRYDVKTNNSSNQYFVNYQKYKFDNLALRDADRLMLGIRNNRQFQNRNRALYLALSAKLFPSKPEFSYYQFDSRATTNWTKSKDIYSNTGIRINYFPESTNQNFADIQFSFGNNGALFYSFSTFNRLYYQIQPLTNITDVNIVSGFNYKQFKIGPSLSLHALFNVEEFEFRTDGNFYRLGAYVESNLSLPYQINLSLTASYDYGFIYSQQFEQDNTTGELTFGDVNERHPTTFQLNTLLSTTIISNTDIFLRLNMYVIDTDITSIISRDPFEQNTRFMLRLGARYSFN
jgi:hypothetical protein